jgi:protein-disulfide isomerase
MLAGTPRALSRGARLTAALAVFALAGCGGSEAPDTTGRDVAANLQLVAGLPQDGITLGSLNADATLTVFDSLDAFNRGLFLSELPEIVREHVADGDLNIQVRTVTTPGVGQASGSGAVDAARLAQAVGLQDKLWDFYGALSARYVGVIDQTVLDAALGDVEGIDAEQARLQSGSRDVGVAIERANRLASKAGVVGLPAYTLTRGTLGKPVELDASCVGCLAGAVDRELSEPAPTPTATATPEPKKNKPKRTRTPTVTPTPTP